LILRGVEETRSEIVLIDVGPNLGAINRAALIAWDKRGSACIKIKQQKRISMENDKFQGLVLEHLANLTQEITELKKEVGWIKASVIRIENDYGEKLGVLFDAREVQMDVNERICETLIRFEDNIEHLDLKIRASEALLKFDGQMGRLTVKHQ
jgi:hypothetical protein